MYAPWNSAKSGLVQPVNDIYAGKKGYRNKNPRRPSRSCKKGGASAEPQSAQAPEGFSLAIHHNKPFTVTFLDAPKAEECWSCKTGFIRRTKSIPFDIILGVFIKRGVLRAA